MKTSSTTVTISPVNLGNGHVGIAINGHRLERQMTRNNGSLYWVAESYTNLKEIRVTEMDSRWPLPFINGISIDGVIAVRPGITVINNTNIDITYIVDDIAQALSILRNGGHYKHAVPIGVEAVLQNDYNTLRQLVDAAHDDTGLIEALQTATGKKLAYLAHEF